MALTDKKYVAIHDKTGEGKTKLKDEFDGGHMARLAATPDEEPMFASLIYQIGDLNYSSTVDIFDLLMIADEIHLNQSFNFLSDLNRDNSIDSNDIYLILINILDF